MQVGSLYMRRFRQPVGNLRPAWLAAVSAILLIAVIAALVTLSANVDRFDLSAVADTHEHTFQPLTGWILAVTALGGTDTVILVTALAVAALAAARHWRGALALALSVVLTEVTVTLLKLVFERPRP